MEKLTAQCFTERIIIYPFVFLCALTLETRFSMFAKFSLDLSVKLNPTAHGREDKVNLWEVVNTI